MRSRFSRTVRHFTHVYLHAQTAVDAGDIRTWQTTVILITRETRRPPIWSPCRNQDGAGSGISLVYLWSQLKVGNVKLFKKKKKKKNINLQKKFCKQTHINNTSVTHGHPMENSSYRMQYTPPMTWLGSDSW